MRSHRGAVVLLPPNRVWRSYPGGATLDRLAGEPGPRDSPMAEDWIASVTTAVSPGREHLREGVSRVLVNGHEHDLARLVADDPGYFLGAAHLARHGPRPMLLVKFLDSAIRLHFQAHPSPEFARAHLGSPSGKTEAYHVLGVREGEADPRVHVGFQRPPTREALRAMIEAQDVAAMEACFDPVPVRPGDTLLVPGGWPHALGPGLFLIEIQEPTDFVVRYEFERGGHVLPEAARFMGRGIDFALSLIDRDAHPPEEIEARVRCPPGRIHDFGTGSFRDELIGPARTPCFRVWRTVLAGPLERAEDAYRIVIVSDGACTVSTPAGAHRLRRYDKILLPAGIGPVRFEPEPTVELIECLPPA